MTAGNELKALLKKKGILQRDLSLASQINESNVSEIINGSRMLSPHHLGQIEASGLFAQDEMKVLRAAAWLDSAEKFGIDPEESYMAEILRLEELLISTSKDITQGWLNNANTYSWLAEKFRDLLKQCTSLEERQRITQLLAITLIEYILALTLIAPTQVIMKITLAELKELRQIANSVRNRPEYYEMIPSLSGLTRYVALELKESKEILESLVNSGHYQLTTDRAYSRVIRALTVIPALQFSLNQISREEALKDYIPAENRAYRTTDSMFISADGQAVLLGGIAYAQALLGRPEAPATFKLAQAAHLRAIAINGFNAVSEASLARTAVIIAINYASDPQTIINNAQRAIILSTRFGYPRIPSQILTYLAPIRDPQIKHFTHQTAENIYGLRHIQQRLTGGT